MADFMDASTMIWVRMASSPVVGLTLADDGIVAKARTCSLLAMGASALKQKVVAITPNGKDYYTGLPITNGKDTVLLAAMRWGVGRQSWQQTGEWMYPLLGPWEARAIGEISENSRAWRWRRSAGFPL